MNSYQEVKAKPNLRIAMESDAQMLEGVVVTGMSKVDKRLFTGAADKVDASKARMHVLTLPGIPQFH